MNKHFPYLSRRTMLALLGGGLDHQTYTLAFGQQDGLELTATPGELLAFAPWAAAWVVSGASLRRGLPPPPCLLIPRPVGCDSQWTVWAREMYDGWIGKAGLDGAGRRA